MQFVCGCVGVWVCMQFVCVCVGVCSVCVCVWVYAVCVGVERCVKKCVSSEEMVS